MAIVYKKLELPFQAFSSEGWITRMGNILCVIIDAFLQICEFGITC